MLAITPARSWIHPNQFFEVTVILLFCLFVCLFVCLFDHISTLTPPVVGKEPRTLLTERETLQSASKRRVEVQVKCFTHTFSERFLVGWRVTKMIPQKCDRSCHYVVLFHIVRRGFHMWEESQTIGYFDFSRPSHIFCNL